MGFKENRIRNAVTQIIQLAGNHAESSPLSLPFPPQSVNVPLLVLVNNVCTVGIQPFKGDVPTGFNLTPPINLKEGAEYICTSLNEKTATVFHKVQHGGNVYILTCARNGRLMDVSKLNGATGVFDLKDSKMGPSLSDVSKSLLNAFSNDHTFQLSANAEDYVLSCSGVWEVTRHLKVTQGGRYFQTFNGGDSFSSSMKKDQIILFLEELQLALRIRQSQLREKIQKRVSESSPVRNAERTVAPDMAWLARGLDDPFPEYIHRKREDLPLADFTDDQLANYAFMHYDRDRDAEVEVMMSQLQPSPKHVTKIAFMTSVKERMRWLSRRLAVAEGRYPGQSVPREQWLTMLGLKKDAFDEEICIAVHRLLTDLLYPEDDGDKPRRMVEVVSATTSPDKSQVKDWDDVQAVPSSGSLFEVRPVPNRNMGECEPPSLQSNLSGLNPPADVWSLSSLDDAEFTELYGQMSDPVNNPVPEKYKELCSKLTIADFHDEAVDRLNRDN